MTQWLKKKSACYVGDTGFHPCIKKIPWRRKWLTAPVFLPGKTHGQRNLAGYSPRGRKKSDTTQWVNNNNGNSLPVCLPYFLYSFIHWLTFRLFPIYWLLWIVLQGTWGWRYPLRFWSQYFEYIPPNRLNGSFSNFIFKFLRNTVLFSLVTAPFHIPSNSVQGFQFLHILANSYLFKKKNYSQLNKCEVII